MKQNPEIITNRELNRAFSREVQGCMVDGYDIDGKESESSWGNPHVVLVKSQRGKKDTYRVVQLSDCKRRTYDGKTPDARIIEVVEYKNRDDVSWHKNGDILSQRVFYRIGASYGDKCAWTENKDFAINVIDMQNKRYRSRFTPRGSDIKLTPATLLALTTLVRRHGNRCKCVQPRDIISASIGQNFNNKGPVRVNISVKRGKNGPSFTVCVSAKRAIDYSLTTPHNIAIESKLLGNRGQDKDYVICKLIENASSQSYG